SAGTIASRLSSASWWSTVSGGAGTSTSSAIRGHRRPDTRELENLARAVRVGVLVEEALACPPAHLLCRAGIAEQLAIGGNRFVGGRDHSNLRPRLEPALD